MDGNNIDTYVNIEDSSNRKNALKRISKALFLIFKNIFYRLLAMIGLILAAPLMILIALAIKLDSKGDVFFKQVRTGKGGKNFLMYKFRTMVQNNDVHDFSKDDEHTKIGKILRKTSLDELPQLFSIASGKMSFIGPRPWIPDYYENMNEKQRHRYDIKPGLTGLAQVMGRNNLTIFEKINFDLEYIENLSLIQDIRIVFLTIIAVFSGKGADAGKCTIQEELMDLKKNNKNDTE